MATRALVDSSIDAFWKAAGTARPTTPQDLLRRTQPTKRATAQKTAKRASSVAVQSARKSEPDTEVHEEFRAVTVELSGREGFNAVAINGIWQFWLVRNGRLAFRREVEIEVERDDIQETTGDGSTADREKSPDDEAAPTTSRGGSNRGVATVRLFLHYVPQVDSFLISDAADESGTVVADCGPVSASGEDLGQHWRVWDGERWREDRNIVAEVAFDGPQPPTLMGLRVIQPAALTGTSGPGSRTRAHSQEARMSATLTAYPPVEPRAPLSARPQRLPRR